MNRSRTASGRSGWDSPVATFRTVPTFPRRSWAAWWNRAVRSCSASRTDARVRSRSRACPSASVCCRRKYWVALSATPELQNSATVRQTVAVTSAATSGWATAYRSISSASRRCRCPHSRATSRG